MGCTHSRSSSVSPIPKKEFPEQIQTILNDVGENLEKIALLKGLENCEVNEDSNWEEELRKKLDNEMGRLNFHTTMDAQAVFQEYQELSQRPDRKLAREIENEIADSDERISNKISDTEINIKDHIFENKQNKQIKEKLKLLMQQLGQFNLEISVPGLLRLLCLTDTNDAEAKQQFQHLGEEMLRKSFTSTKADGSITSTKADGSIFEKVVEKKWQEAAYLVLDSMIIEKKGADGDRKFDVLFDVLDEQKGPEGLPKGYCQDLLSWFCWCQPEQNMYQYLATTSNSLVNHGVCRLLTEKKIQLYKKWFYLSASFYLVATLCLTYTLVTSVMAENVREYSSGLDYSRAVFEVVSAICAFVCLYLELLQVNWLGLLYFTDFGNWQELSSAFLLCLTVPLRFEAEQYHWYIFAAGYLIWISLTYKQFILIKQLYLQFEIFAQVIKQDVKWFMVLFLVVNLAFCGASLLTLRGDNDLHVDSQISSAPAWFFMGLRTLAEGQPVLDYAGNGEYSPVSTIVFVLFLFVTCVILLNLLIAQLGQTLENVSKTLDKNYNIKLAHTVAWMEINITKWQWLWLWIFWCCAKRHCRKAVHFLSNDDFQKQANGDR